MKIIKDEKNKFILDKSSDTKRNINIEIGDVKQLDFYPQMKIIHWDNECNFSARLKDENYNLGTVKEAKDKIEWKKDNRFVRFYDKGNEGFEFEVEFLSIPDSNIIEFTIQTKELNFYYQPELTEEEIKQGVIRPDNIVGSYAVYHKSKINNIEGGKSYETGKVFHIYRPYVIDSNDNQRWCDLFIDEINGLLLITIPQDFLDKASYPVILDPTFGITSQGGSQVGVNASDWKAIRVAAPEDGSATAITGWFNAGSAGRSIKAFITDNSLIILTNGIGTAVGLPLGVSQATSVISNASLTNGSFYYFGCMVNSTNTNGYYDTVSSAGYTHSNNFTSPTDPTTATSNSNRWSFFVTYTSSSLATTVKRRMVFIE